MKGAPERALEAKVPTRATLEKYGLDEVTWRRLLAEQDGVCFVCHQLPRSGRLCVDHEHVPGWKKKSAFERARYVRGLLCYRCNTTYVGRSIDVARARRVVAYLERHQRRAYGLEGVA